MKLEDLKVTSDRDLYNNKELYYKICQDLVEIIHRKIIPDFFIERDMHVDVNVVFSSISAFLCNFLNIPEFTHDQRKLMIDLMNDHIKKQVLDDKSA